MAADGRLPSMAEKHYAHYLTTTEYYKLAAACTLLWQSFDSLGVYLVGSVLRKRDWRDVDVRVILTDDEYARLFPVTNAHGENAYWKLICIAISSYLTSVTGLPVDFQIQQQTRANTQYPSGEGHCRNAIGLFLVD